MQNILQSISQEDLNLLPVKEFEGNIVVIDNILDISKAVKFLKSKPVLGFDTETRPAFKKGVVYPVSLLQLSTENEVFLFRLNKSGFPHELATILSDKNIVKAGVAITDDIKLLQKRQPFKPASFVELQTYVKKFGITDASLQKLTAIVLGFKISKAQRISNWDNEELTPAQIRYAATDAWTGINIYKKLSESILSKNI